MLINPSNPVETILQVDSVMNRVEESGVFGRSKRQIDLLEYLLLKNSTGQIDSVSEYAIAQEVFGRDESFDPQIDSNVRVEMHRLRQNLKKFNAIDDQYSIILPPSTYKLNVHSKHATPPPWFTNWQLVLTLATIILCAVIVIYALVEYLPRPAVRKKMLPVIQTNMDSDTPVSGQLPRYAVFEQSLLETLKGDGTMYIVTQADHAGDVDYILDISDHNFMQGVTLKLSRPDGEIVWMRNIYDENMDDADVQKRLAWDITYSLISEDSIISTDFINFGNLSRRDKKFLECVYDMDILVTSGKMNWHDDISEIYTCPKYFTGLPPKEAAAAHTSMAGIYLAQAKGYIPKTVDDPFSKAQAEYDTATKLDIPNWHYYLMGVNIELERDPRDLATLRNLLERVEVQFPHNHPINYTLSQSYGYVMGDWDKAAAMQPPIPKGDKHNLINVQIVHDLINNDTKAAVEKMSHFMPSGIPIFNAIGALTYCKSGDAEQIQYFRQQLTKNKIADVKTYTDFIRSRRYAANTEALFLSITEPPCAVFHPQNPE